MVDRHGCRIRALQRPDPNQRSRSHQARPAPDVAVGLRTDRPTYLPARLAAADLLRERFNNQEEDGSIGDYLAALKINPKSPAAHVGIGAVALESWNFEETEQRADAPSRSILGTHQPCTCLPASTFSNAATLRRPKPAKALAIDANDLVALSIAAAAAACRYDQPRVDELAARVAAINPRCATFHRTVADALSGIRQYQASEKEYLVAIELDPTDANARTELGMMYMQWGRRTKPAMPWTPRGRWTASTNGPSLRWTCSIPFRSSPTTTPSISSSATTRPRSRPRRIPRRSPRGNLRPGHRRLRNAAGSQDGH